MRKKSGVYAIVNVENGKLYVGSSVHVEDRWKEHFRELQRGIHGNPYLQNAFNKCGPEAFSFHLLESVDDLESLYIREQYWMDLSRSYVPQNGYNISSTALGVLGDKNPAKRPEVREKISRAHKGRVFTEEWKERISESLQGTRVGADNSFYGKTHTEETRRL